MRDARLAEQVEAGEMGDEEQGKQMTITDDFDDTVEKYSNNSSN